MTGPRRARLTSGERPVRRPASLGDLLADASAATLASVAGHPRLTPAQRALVARELARRA